MKLFKRFIMLCLVLAMLITPIFSMNLTASALVGAGAPSATNPEWIFGIDLSYYQVGQNALDYSRVNFTKLKSEGVQFVILRIGYETSTTSGIKSTPPLTSFIAEHVRLTSISVFISTPTRSLIMHQKPMRRRL